MGDSSEDLSDSDSSEDSYFMDLLRHRDINLNNDEDAMHWILNHIDYFLGQSHTNQSIENVALYPCLVDDHLDDNAWDKFGQAIGNLQALKRLDIRTPNYHDHDYDDDDANDEIDIEVSIPDWEILARILRHVRQSITLTVTIDNVHVLIWTEEHSLSLGRALYEHPTITCFEAGDFFPYMHGAPDALYSALASMPALEAIRLSNRGLFHLRPEDEYVMARPENLTELLRLPSLRSVCFSHYYFTRALCQATANALMEGAAVTKLEFRECEFSDGECSATMASAFSRNTSLLNIEVALPVEEAIIGALAAALPSNSTLQELFIEVDDTPGAHVYWLPIFLALGKNQGLKTLTLDGLGSMDESLSTAIKNGLRLHETLESLQLHNIHLRDAEFALWCKAFSFLRTNTALTSLMVKALEHDVTKACLTTFCFDIAAMLEENVSLQVLSIRSWTTSNFEFEEYLALVPALQGNLTLKILQFCDYVCIRLTDDEGKQMAALLRKNYGLESLPDMDLSYLTGDACAILRLNKAGRRYLVQDGSSISKGVQVLSSVNNDINCVFLHLLENPRLCDRSAVEVPDADESNSSSTSPTARSRSGGGKREKAVGDEGRESRRRLA